jgi:hypothetical protein
VKDTIAAIVGKRIIQVVTKKSDTSPKSQVYLVFDDGTHFELFSVDSYISCSSRVYPGGKDYVIAHTPVKDLGFIFPTSDDPRLD